MLVFVTSLDDCNSLKSFCFFKKVQALVSGLVAERVKFGEFVVFSLVLTAFIYPVAGSWQWNGGWLSELGFIDFAGSSIVHSVGAWAGLVGAMLLGPRIGKFVNGVKVDSSFFITLSTR